MIRKTFLAAAIVVCAVWAPASAQAPAAAQEKKWYVGASFLSSSAEFDTTTGTVNPSADGWKAFIGYDIHKYFGIEGSYYDFGDLEDSTSVATVTADIQAYDISFRGMLPVGKLLRFTGKIGYSSVDIEAESTGPFLIVSGTGSGWELMYGVGAEVNLGRRFGIRADWEKWDVEGSLDAWSIGAYFRF